MTRGIRLLSALACLTLGGCFSYRTADLPSVRDGSPVLVRVSPAEARRMEEVLGVDQDLEALQGVAELRENSDSLYLSMVLTPLRGSSARSPLRATIPVDRREIEGIRIRSFDGKRTAALVAASALVTTLLLESQFGGSNEKQGTDDPGGIDQTLITFFRFRW